MAMTLRGSLVDFGVADVMAQLGSEHRQGVLTLRGHDEEVRLFFAEGAVVGSEARRRRKQERLGAMLVRAALISPEQLEQALARQQASGQRLGDLLADIGAVTADDLQRVARLQTSETVFRVFLWRSGTYEFVEGSAGAGPVHPPLAADTLLMEAFRQADAWPTIRRRLGSYTLTFRPLTDLAALAAAPSAQLALTASDWHIAGLLAPDRDVQRLIDLGQLGEFVTCQALLNLLDNDLIVIAPSQQASPSAAATVGGISAPRGDHGKALASMVGTLLLALAAWGAIWGSGAGPAWPQAGPVTGTSAWRTAREAAQIARIDQALRAYRALTGEFPARLSELRARRLLPAAALDGLPYRYARGDGRYALLPGPPADLGAGEPRATRGAP